MTRQEALRRLLFFCYHATFANLSHNPKQSHMRKAFVYLFLGFSFSFSFGQFNSFQQEVSNMQAAFSQGVAEDKTGCLTIALFQHDQIILEDAFGWANIEQGIPAIPETIGRTGSISKTITALVMMGLLERKLIHLDDPISQYLPELNGLKTRSDQLNEITFRRIASHTAGLEREPDWDQAASGSIYYWEDKLLASIPHTSLKTNPGKEFSYSNIGYGILGYALSRAANKPFIDLVEELVFKPIGMKNSYFIVNEPESLERLSIGYYKDRESGEVLSDKSDFEHFGRGFKVPAGGVYSTASDLAKMASQIMGSAKTQAFSIESMMLMQQKQLPAEAYGFGLFIREKEELQLVGHSGSVAGYNARLMFDPESGLGIAALWTTAYRPSIDDWLVKLIKSKH